MLILFFYISNLDWLDDLRGEDQLRAINAAKVAIEIGTKAIPQLDWAIDNEKSPKKQILLLWVRNSIKPDRINAYASLLKSNDPQILIKTLENLSQFPEAKELIPQIQKLLEQETQIYNKAIVCLAKLGDQSVYDLCIDGLFNDTTVKSSLYALGQLKNPDCLYLLESFAIEPTHSNFEDYSFRQNVIAAIRQIGGDSAAYSLLNLAYEADCRGSGLALQALGKLGINTMGQALIEILNDEENIFCGFSRWEAAQSLGELKVQAAIPALAHWSIHGFNDLKYRCVAALGSFEDPDTLPTLMLCLKDSEWIVRRDAAEAMGKILHASSLNALLAATRDEHPSVRKKVAISLSQFQDNRARSALEEMAYREKNEEVIPVLVKILK